MDKMLYISMSTAQQTMRAQAANSNNLANVNTTGFRADFEQFRSIPVIGEGVPSRVYSVSERVATNFEQGTLQPTGRELDIAVQGEGFIAVQGKDGSEGYTRAGDLHITPSGQLTTGTGLVVLGDGGPISIPAAEKVEIGSDGTISIRPLGADSSALAQIARIKLVNPEISQLQKSSDGLIRSADGAILPSDASVKVASGLLESSNVNAVGSLVKMISLQRQYEMQIKMMATAQENSTSSAELLRLGN